MSRRAAPRLLAAGVVLAGVVVGGLLIVRETPRPGPAAPVVEPASDDSRAARERLLAELQPVRLSNCTLERFGEPHDGGYLMCGNLLDEVRAGYSYGISGYDGWGCDVSRRLGVRVHQYDCFNLTRPACPDGRTVFHAECIAGEPRTDSEGRPFDTLASQLAGNGDADHRIVLKLDVEGAEWDSLLSTPPDVLARVDQLAIEFHGVDAEIGKYLDVITRLKEQFHVVHLHFNNYSCTDNVAPFPAYAYEVLFVSKRVGVLSRDQMPVRRPHALDAPNSPSAPDCQQER